MAESDSTSAASFEMTLEEAEHIVAAFAPRDLPALKKLSSFVLAGAGLATGEAVGPLLLALIEPAKDSISALDRLSRSLRASISGARRTDRVDLLRAIIFVNVVNAYFKAYSNLLPKGLKTTLAMNQQDIRAIVDRDNSASSARPSRDDLAPIPVLATTVAGVESLVQSVKMYYQDLKIKQQRTLIGLSAWEALPQRQRMQVQETVFDHLPEFATQNFRAALLELLRDYPDLRVWLVSNAIEQVRAKQDQSEQTQSEILAGVQAILADGSTGAHRQPAAPTQPEQRLRATYTLFLEEKIFRSSAAPADVEFPLVKDGFVPARFRTSPVGAIGSLSSDIDWGMVTERQDGLLNYLAAEVANPANYSQPIIILGHPGSGKSLLSRLMAANVSAAPNLCPVYVELRTIPLRLPLELMVEEAVSSLSGQSLNFTHINDNTSQLVVIFDGLDELVMTSPKTKVDNFLREVEQFQLRARAAENPLAVIVTSRNVFLDHVYVNRFSVAVRLEPFSDLQVGDWCERWNKYNPDKSLAPETVLELGDLPRQPLLLALIALYDAETNGLESLVELDRTMLYDELFREFLSRETFKHAVTAGSAPPIIVDAIPILAAVAAFMAEGGTFVVAGPDFEGIRERIKAALPHDTDDTDPFLVLRSFFFVHNSSSRVSLASEPRWSYEFLHKSFMEFFIAQYMKLCLQSVSRRNSARSHRALTQLLRSLPLWREESTLSFASDLVKGAVAGGPSGVREILLRIASEESLAVCDGRDGASTSASSMLIANCLLLILRSSDETEVILAPAAGDHSIEYETFARTCGPLLRAGLSDEDLASLGQAIRFVALEDETFRLLRAPPNENVPSPHGELLSLGIAGWTSGDRVIQELAVLFENLAGLQGSVRPAAISSKFRQMGIVNAAYRVAIESAISKDDVGRAAELFRYWCNRIVEDRAELPSFSRTLASYAADISPYVDSIVHQLCNAIRELPPPVTIDLIFALARVDTPDPGTVELLGHLGQQVTVDVLLQVDSVKAMAVAGALSTTDNRHRLDKELYQAVRQTPAPSPTHVLGILSGLELEGGVSAYTKRILREAAQVYADHRSLSPGVAQRLGMGGLGDP